ncbi:MAG: hypothetical protein ACRYFU_15870 [Janthinobacterium lividum]
MSLMDAPVFDDRRARRNQAMLIGLAVSVALLFVLFFLGYILGHGWLFTNLPAEHRVSSFYTALEQKDYAKAYGIYNHDPDWQQHQAKYASYPLSRFTEDWTTSYSPVNGPIISHHMDVSKTDGTGYFGTGIIVAATLNSDHKAFIYVDRSDGTFIYPSPHIIEY